MTGKEPPQPLYIERDAVISSCDRYRYTLTRRWSWGEMVMFVGLNPSIADARLDDPTIRRCVGFARAWGYGGLVMTNLFAWRATYPREMMRAADPVGPLNNGFLNLAYAKTALTVAAWGALGAHLGRAREVRALLPRLHYLRLTQDGQPSHPLRLPASLRPVPWSQA